MKTRYSAILVFTLLLAGGLAHADAPLKSKLDLSTEQAGAVADIQADYRRTFAKKRQAFNRESRALRRARTANDPAAIAKQESVVAALKAEMTAIRIAENNSIRAQLTPDQQLKFDEVIAERAAMVGSSRDSNVTGR